MTATTIVQQLAQFSVDSRFERLPEEVVNECKRLVLDSVGCALGGIEHPKGRIGIEYARMTGGSDGSATIIGSARKCNPFSAAFANGELIQALDYDAILPPGHVVPYVLPGAMALAEANGASGADLIAAVAVSHEMSYRLGKAMDYLRDIKDGKLCPPKVYGYSSTIFGAAAAIGMIKGMPAERIAHALGIAGSIAPVNSHWTWCQHAPATTIKYLTAGQLVQSAMTAAHMADLGHRGDFQMLDDRDVGFPRIIGTTRWEPAPITAQLGSEWRFPSEQSYKPYPHCRILHALLDCQIKLIEDNDIQPHEIESIKALVEGFVMQPIWLMREIADVTDAQFSIAHGLALGAQRIPPGKAWQDPKVVYSQAVMDLMPKVSYEVHPDYVKMLTSHAASRPARIEIKARGQTFVAESRFPKGSPSTDPSSTMSTDELVLKFRGNADGVISRSATDRFIDATLNLEKVADLRTLMDLVRPVTGASRPVAAPAPQEAVPAK